MKLFKSNPSELVKIDYIKKRAVSGIYTCYFDIIDYKTGKQINNGSCVVDSECKILATSVDVPSSLINKDYRVNQIRYAMKIKEALQARFPDYLSHH